MTNYLSQQQIVAYLSDVLELNVLDEEIARIQRVMVEVTKQKDDPRQRIHTVHITQVFRALLTEKAREEVVQNMGDHYSGGSENSGSGPAYNPTRSVRIRHILEQQVTGGR